MVTTKIYIFARMISRSAAAVLTFLTGRRLAKT